MDIGKITDELVDLLEANATGRITHRDAWRRATRTRLESQGDEAIKAQHAKLTGTSTKTSSTGENYNVRTIDHAITDALVILARGFDTPTAMLLLTDDYDPATAGRALALASDDAYTIDLGHTPNRATDQAKWNPISLAEYQAITGDTLTTILRTNEPEPVDVEDIGW